MKRGFAIASSFALAVFALGGEIPAARAQMGMPPQCAQFPAMSAATKKKADAVSEAMKAKADRKEICRLMTAFVASEGSIIKFLIANKTWCGVPDQAVTNASASHEKSIKFRDVVCTEAPAPKAPTLSDAIKTPQVDSSSNTKSGRGGTFDTLTGNPLGR